jgi:hypothetical protein
MIRFLLSTVSGMDSPRQWAAGLALGLVGGCIPFQSLLVVVIAVVLLLSGANLLTGAAGWAGGWVVARGTIRAAGFRAVDCAPPAATLGFAQRVAGRVLVPLEQHASHRFTRGWPDDRGAPVLHRFVRGAARPAKTEYCVRPLCPDPLAGPGYWTGDQSGDRPDMKRGRFSFFATRLVIFGALLLIAGSLAPRLMQESAVRWLGLQTGMEWTFRLDSGGPGSPRILVSEIAAGPRVHGELIDAAAATLASEAEARVAKWGWLDGRVVIDRLSARGVHSETVNALLGPELASALHLTNRETVADASAAFSAEPPEARAWVDSIAVEQANIPELQFEAVATPLVRGWEGLDASLQPASQALADGLAAIRQTGDPSPDNPLREGLLLQRNAEKVRRLNEVAEPLRAQLATIESARAADLAALTKARDDDLAAIQASSQAAPLVLGRADLADAALLRPVATRLAEQVLEWTRAMRQLCLARGTPGSGLLGGRTIHLHGSSAAPGIEVRELVLEGTARLPNARFEYILTAENLSTAGPTALAPMQLVLRGQGPYHLLVECTCAGPDSGQVHLTCSAIQMPELRLGAAGLLEMETGAGSFSVDARLNWTANDLVEGEILLGLDHDTSRIASLHPLVSALIGANEIDLPSGSAGRSTGFDCRIGIEQLNGQTAVTVEGGPGKALMIALNTARQRRQQQGLNAATEAVHVQYGKAVAAVESRAGESLARLKGLLQDEATLMAELERLTPGASRSTLRR